MMRMKGHQKEKDRHGESRRGFRKFEELGKMKNPKSREGIKGTFLFKETETYKTDRDTQDTRKIHFISMK